MWHALVYQTKKNRKSTGEGGGEGRKGGVLGVVTEGDRKEDTEKGGKGGKSSRREETMHRLFLVEVVSYPSEILTRSALPILSPKRLAANNDGEIWIKMAYGSLS